MMIKKVLLYLREVLFAMAMFALAYLSGHPDGAVSLWIVVVSSVALVIIHIIGERRRKHQLIRGTILIFGSAIVGYYHGVNDGSEERGLEMMWIAVGLGLGLFLCAWAVLNWIMDGMKSVYSTYRKNLLKQHLMAMQEIQQCDDVLLGWNPTSNIARIWLEEGNRAYFEGGYNDEISKLIAWYTSNEPTSEEDGFLCKSFDL